MSEFESKPAIDLGALLYSQSPGQAAEGPSASFHKIGYGGMLNRFNSARMPVMKVELQALAGLGTPRPHPAAQGKFQLS